MAWPKKDKRKWFQKIEGFEDNVDEPLIDLDEYADFNGVGDPLINLLSDAATDVTATEAEDLRQVIEEIYRRKHEALNLYEPMPDQEAFHSSLACERLILGSNRAGKTLASCVEIARAVTGQDPYDKYSKRDGRFIVVGKSEQHLGEVLFRKLFKPGAFKVIFDPKLDRVRAYRPWESWDWDHADLAKAAPPLIPHRFYSAKNCSWKDKRGEIPDSITIPATGWRISFFSGGAEPPQGWDADAAAFDEEIAHPSWYTEVAARLMDRRERIPGSTHYRNGRFFWGATPQVGTEHLYNLSERADEEAGDDNPSITKVHLTIKDNPYIDDQAKKDFGKKLLNNDDEYDVRVLGKFAILGSRVFPELAPRGVHGVPTFTIPEDWTRYVAIDPGRQVAAALFCAVPPPAIHEIEIEGRLYWVRSKKIIYDELYIKRCSAAIFAERMKAKVGLDRIHAWYIDSHIGRQTEMGSGKTVAQWYSDHFKIHDLSCELTQEYFSWSSGEVHAGIEAIRSNLHVVDGHSRWVFQYEKLPHFLEEAKHYAYKKSPGTKLITDDPLQKNNHTIDCARYLAEAPLRYVRPKERLNRRGYVNEILEKRRRERRGKSNNAVAKLY